MGSRKMAYVLREACASLEAALRPPRRAARNGEGIPLNLLRRDVRVNLPRGDEVRGEGVG